MIEQAQAEALREFDLKIHPDLKKPNH